MKWKKYYHLPEIDEIREKIINTYTNKLVFLDEPHEYYLDGVKYMCVSEVTHKYKPTTSEQMAENCVKKWQRDQDPSYKYYGMCKKYWINGPKSPGRPVNSVRKPMHLVKACFII